MNIDWKNPNILSSPLKERKKKEIIARDNLRKSKRHKKKNHSTNKEKSFSDRSKHNKGKYKSKIKRKNSVLFNKKVKAYWRGELDNFPVK
jgi:hypothetical protein